MSFKTSSLASLSSLITKGTTPTTLGYAHSDSGIPFLRVQNIFSGQVNFKEDTLFIDSNTHTALKRSQIQGGDVLVTIAGTIGRTGVVPHDAPEMNCNQAVAIVRPTPEIERSYLRHWLESQDARSQMLGSTVTGTISNLSLSQLGELRVPLPSLEEQRRIAAILDQAETLRTQRRTALALLDSLTQSLFLDMFGDPVANPKGFTKQPLSEVAEITTGSTPGRGSDGYYGGNIPWIKTTEVTGGEIHDTEEKLTESGLKAIRGKLHPINSIVVAMYGQGQTRGRCALLRIEASCNQACGVVRPSEEFVPWFMFTQLLLAYERLRALGRGGNQENLNLQLLGSFEVLLPPLPLQQTFATRIASIEALKTTHRRALAALDALFASLQQRAFTGAL